MELGCSDIRRTEMSGICCPFLPAPPLRRVRRLHRHRSLHQPSPHRRSARHVLRLRPTRRRQGLRRHPRYRLARRGSHPRRPVSRRSDPARSCQTPHRRARHSSRPRSLSATADRLSFLPARACWRASSSCCSVWDLTSGESCGGDSRAQAARRLNSSQWWRANSGWSAVAAISAKPASATWRQACGAPPRRLRPPWMKLRNASGYQPSPSIA